MKVARDASGESDERDEVFGDVHGLDRAEAQAFEARAAKYAAQQAEQIGARHQIASVTAEMNSAQNNFTVAARCEGVQFIDNALGREAAAISTNGRNHAEGAAMIAAILDFQDGARVPRFAAFDGRDENIRLRKDIADENCGGAGNGSCDGDTERRDRNEASAGK